MGGKTEGKETGFIETLSGLSQQLAHGPDIAVQAPKKAVARIVSPLRAAAQKALQKQTIAAPGADLVPGVILRVEAKPSRLALMRVPVVRGRPAKTTVEHPLTFPFTGEYRLFPTSSALLHHEWAIESGTLLEHEYATSGGGSLETEAFERFHPPIDFSNCGKVRLVFVSEEDGYARP